MELKVLVLLALLATATLASRSAINHDIISAVNNDPASTWTAGVNSFFEGKTIDEVKGLLGVSEFSPEPLSMIGPDAAAAMAQKAAARKAKLPTSFDARKKWPKCMHPVLNQAQCGSCWAFSLTEVMTNRMCIQGLKDEVLSPQDLVSCDYTNYGCQGGILNRAWSFVEKQGVTSWECLPYTSGNGTTGSCPSHCADGSPIKRVKAVHARHINELFGRDDAIAEEIVNNGPVQVAFKVYEDFMHYTGGVYQHKTGSMLGGHAVMAIGFGEENGVPYWLIQNSWGTSWPSGASSDLQGMFKIKRGSNECGIESDVWAGDVAA